MNISIFILLAKCLKTWANVPPICDIQSKAFHSKKTAKPLSFLRDTQQFTRRSNLIWIDRYSCYPHAWLMFLNAIARSWQSSLLVFLLFTTLIVKSHSIRWIWYAESYQVIKKEKGFVHSTWIVRMRSTWSSLRIEANERAYSSTI